MNTYERIDQWIDQHFDEQVKFLQALVRVPTDTPPGNNTPHAVRTAELLLHMGMQAEQFDISQALVQAHGLTSVTNLIVRRRYGDGLVVALNAHGDVVPPGDGWTHDPYGAEIVDGKLFGRASAVSKCDFSTFTFAVRALEAVAKPSKGSVELHFTYDEEFGGELGPGWLLATKWSPPITVVCKWKSPSTVAWHMPPYPTAALTPCKLPWLCSTLCMHKIFFTNLFGHTWKVSVTPTSILG